MLRYSPLDGDSVAPRDLSLVGDVPIQQRVVREAERSTPRY